MKKLKLPLSAVTLILIMLSLKLSAQSMAEGQSFFQPSLTIGENQNRGFDLRFGAIYYKHLQTSLDPAYDELTYEPYHLKLYSAGMSARFFVSVSKVHFFLGGNIRGAYLRQSMADKVSVGYYSKQGACIIGGPEAGMNIFLGDRFALEAFGSARIGEALRSQFLVSFGPAFYF